MARGAWSDRGGFTLLEVLIAFAILSVAIVSLIQLTSQGLRLLKVSGDHQQAVQLADRIARDTQVNPDEVQAETVVDTGEEGDFAWERKIARVALPEEIEPKTPAPGKELPGLYEVSVAVRWGRNHVVEVATLRAPAPVTPGSATASTDDQVGPTTNQTPPGASGTPGTSSSGSSSTSGSGSSTGSRSSGSSFGSGSSSSSGSSFGSGSGSMSSSGSRSRLSP